ncbi:MAG: hypothetical protein JO149_05725 [Gammaproteobacteria bacterium]|nr:hypothetical protein [Gammaproteobacteria bacterium]
MKALVPNCKLAISTVNVGRILTSKAQHEGRVRAIVKMRPTLTVEIANFNQLLV